MHLEKTKNGDERWVPLNEKARAALAALGDQPENHYKHRSFYNGWDAARRHIAPNDETFVFHSLRHTAATWMEMAGVPLTTIARVTGHRSRAALERYLHDSDRAARAAVEALRIPRDT